MNFNAGSKPEEMEPIYVDGRVYFNFTGDLCNKATHQSYNLLILTMCDYSSHTQNPIVFMPYVIVNNTFFHPLHACNIECYLHFFPYAFFSHAHFTTLYAPYAQYGHG